MHERGTLEPVVGNPGTQIPDRELRNSSAFSSRRFFVVASVSGARRAI